MPVALEDEVCAVVLLKAVEEAQAISARDALVELAHEDAAVVGVHILADELADQGMRLTPRDGLARRRDVQDAAVGGQDVQKVLELFNDAPRPVAPLRKLHVLLLCCTLMPEPVGSGPAPAPVRLASCWCCDVELVRFPLLRCCDINLASCIAIVGGASGAYEASAAKSMSRSMGRDISISRPFIKLPMSSGMSIPPASDTS